MHALTGWTRSSVFEISVLCTAAAPKEMPWGTHAYIIRAETAERMANLGEWMMNRARKNFGDKTPWTLDGDDIKIDHFIRNYYRNLVTEVERQRYASWHNTLPV